MHRSLFVVSVALLLAACDTAVPDETVPLTSAEAALAAEVVADALASDSEGITAALYDLTARIGTSGLVYAAAASADAATGAELAASPSDARGVTRSFSVTYDEATGTHRIRYVRELSRPVFSKRVEADLRYVYRDAAGAFIASPGREADRVASIAFEGERSGTMTGQAPLGQHTRASSFTHEASWSLTDVQAPSMRLEGTQRKTGTFAWTAGPNTMERTYDVTFTASDVRIARGNGELETRLTGTLTYSGTLTRTRNGETWTTAFEGTVELDGSGRATLGFLGLPDRYVVDLRSGAAQRR